MNLARSSHLDALCGEYLLGSLRGAARRRFTRALREEPLVALRYQYWQRLFSPRFAASIAIQPDAALWKRLSRELDLDRYRIPWMQRLGLWRTWAGVATAALLAVLTFQMLPLETETRFVEIAQMRGEDRNMVITASLSEDRKELSLRAARPVVAGPSQSYELWLLPESGEAPLSLAVLGQLDARFALPPALVPRLLAGAKFAVSVEPNGGSPTGAPTGPVILAGVIRI